jgi:anaerobic selenocysteine-containing dehydrogenase
MKKITACTMDCPDSCSLLVWKDDDGTVKIQGNPDHPFTSGFTCAKIRRLPNRIESHHRIVTPMIRSGDRWKDMSWDDALDLCAERIDALRSEPSSILHFHGEGAKGVLKQANKFFFALLGASRTKGSLCDAAGFIACLADFGSRFNNDIEDLLNTRRIINWGKDLLRSSVHTSAIVRKVKKQGSPLLTISPGGDGNRTFSDDFIQIRPGTDRFLAAAILRLLVDRDLIGPDILSHTNHWESFRATLFKYSLTELATMCDVTRKDIDRAFAYYADDGPAATLIGTGLQRYRYGGENVRFINALVLLSGNIGRSGGGAYFHQHALTNLNSAWSKGERARRAIAMPTIGRSILEADPPIKMIWINGSNVINQAPDSLYTAEVFERIPFKVVVDAFMTDTSQRADLFLPSTLMLEHEDIVGSYLQNYIHHVEAVLEPPGEARTDFWILTELGKRLHPPIMLPDAESCFRASLELPCLDISVDELRSKKFIKARRPQVAYEDMEFDHADGKYRFPIDLHPEPDPPEGFPFRLLSLIRKDAMHSQILPEDQAIPIDAWVSTECSVLKHLDLEKDVWIASPIGRIKVRLKTLEGLHPSVVMTRRGSWMKHGGGINQLIEAQLSDIGNGAPFYDQYVRLENEIKERE